MAGMTETFHRKKLGLKCCIMYLKHLSKTEVVKMANHNKCNIYVTEAMKPQSGNRQMV